MPYRRPILIVLAALLMGQAPNPPIEAKPDLSSPKAALISAYTALKAGDIPVAKSCFLFKDAAQAEVFEITHTQVYGPLKLMHAMASKFGPASRKLFPNAALDKSIEELLEKINTIEISTTSDTAALIDKKAAINPSAESELTGLEFRKQAGQWKIIAASFADVGDSGGEMPAAQLPLMRALRDQVAAASEATIARLNAGEFKSADEAYTDYQLRLEAGLQAAIPASTQK